MVLAADVIAVNDVPPFRNSAMDGYAVRAADTHSATWSSPVELPVTAHVAAGQRDVPRLGAGEAIRIMTGAPLPMGADAVVRFEETDEASSAGQPDRGAVLVYRAARPSRQCSRGRRGHCYVVRAWLAADSCCGRQTSG